ncbi:hypothetical protein IWW50_006789, partial [Coemansia erecta]
MALFGEKDEELVKTFLFNKIKKECDADPAIMADYILVTLQNDMSPEELKQHCKTDLTEFFGDKTAVFVDTLFDALAKRQYLPVQPNVQSTQPAQPAQPARGREDARNIINNARRRSRSPGYDRRPPRSRSPSRERRQLREPRDSALLDRPLEHQQQKQQQFMQQQQQQQQGFMGQHRKHQQPRPCFEFLRKGKCSRDGCSFAHVSLEQAQMMGMPVPPHMMGQQSMM